MFSPNIFHQKPWSLLTKYLRVLIGVGFGLFFAASIIAGPTNSPPAKVSKTLPSTPMLHFPVSRYDVMGNTLLPKKVLDGIVSKHTGTNITFDDVASAEKELQLEYHNRGYDTISVTIPPQRLTNGVFKIRVFEGKLAEIRVMGNRFYSSNNIMRALPGLKTNIFLNSKLLQPQLDAANANQDRQIYPEIHPGLESNTTMLILRVKDHLPLHAKLEANNESTEGTPDQRIATSMAYDNLWQLNHQIGLQYTFSEEDYKQGGNWAPYDSPLVANYSGFYRFPLSSTQSFADDAANSVGKFGYSEADRKFILPPATGATEMNIYASGSTIDTGIVTGTPKTLFSGTNGIITQDTAHQDLTYNDALGFRLIKPLPELWGFSPHFQAGSDYKIYKEANYETNYFTFYILNEVTPTGQPTNPPPTVTPSPVPGSVSSISYLPLALRLDADRRDSLGTTAIGFGYNPNVWYSGSRSNLESIAGSTHASGYWHIITGAVSREQLLPRDWKVALRADGQWASEPLISNEQFGAGGINGVRGYHEGEVFGDSGWRVTSELKLPSYRIGFAGKGINEPLIVRASFFMDYADTYLLDPQGRKGDTPLWGTGFAGAASLGPHFSGMLSFAWPLLSTPTTEAFQVRVAFSLSAQF
jgi:hemolysin activation/secretion protein